METRESILSGVKRDLVGPQHGESEVLTNRPSDQYLTGILFPIPADNQLEEEGQQAEDDTRDSGDDAEGTAGDAISMQSMRRPNSMGLSFSIGGSEPVLHITGTAGRYNCRWRSGDALVDAHGDRSAERWVRRAILLDCDFPLAEGVKPFDGPEGLRWYVRGHRASDHWQATVVLANELQPLPGRVAAEEATFFQAHFQVRVGGGQLVPRRPRQGGDDDDADTNNLIYRDVAEWAVGHTCSATWDETTKATLIEATWIPTQLVASMDADGDPVFAAESARMCGSTEGAFDAERLALTASVDELGRLLRTVPKAYERWLNDVEENVATLSSSGKLSRSAAKQARAHVARARHAATRMLAGVDLLEKDASVRRAFQLAQAAMLQQLRWSKSDPAAVLRWRPFQLAFQLIVLKGLATPMAEEESPSPDRLTMDLLWFPTGGGKTEAYLALTAFTLFFRRLRNPEAAQGAGVSVLMRYTLRLLTVQQFERAARLILACELERRRAAEAGVSDLGQVPFTIGLWVGSGATPNTIKDARQQADEAEKAKQLARCPACNQASLKWDAARPATRFTVECTNSSCPFGLSELPVATIDEEVYRLRPSLLMGTVDKFAQIVRKEDTAAFFPPEGEPPDLIIQDELHLISGPLGTLAAVYESAVDLLCTRGGVPPKVIGSTATIRRARKHVSNLFNRTVAQFPPPILDAGNSGFAVEDQTLPGRLYVGLTSAGRSPKFLLQALCASLLQAAKELDVSNSDRDPYWTLIAYFNSLRELGGALVMMRDDVRDSISLYAGLHGREPREVPDEVQELTSRIGSKDIPAVLDTLKESYPHQEIAVVLATNMLSVGIDIPRLGLMVVNGQPKSMSEYIQATSRVGRNEVPGLIFTCYNAGRPRDRSHYEAFRTWHQALYRDVEATSVTPFAPRARDRALHAPLVALARHRVPGMSSSPVLTRAKRKHLELLVEELLRRIQNIDPREAGDAAAEIRAFLDSWEARGDIKSYWDDWKDDGLLISAERAATIRALHGAFTGAARPTPNSLRDVEPNVTVRLTSNLD